MVDHLSYPRTVAGLRKELRDGGATDVAVLAQAFREFAVKAAPRVIRKTNVPPELVGMAHGNTTRPVYSVAPGVSRDAREVADIAGRLADALAVAPDLLDALTAERWTTDRKAAAVPLDIPDPAGGPPRWVDAGTLQPVDDDPDDDRVAVSWWPRPPDGAREMGVGLFDIQRRELELLAPKPPPPINWGAGFVPSLDPSTPWGALAHWAEVIDELKERFAGYDNLARTIKVTGTMPDNDPVRQARRDARAAATSYQRWIDFIEPFGDTLAAMYGAYIQTLTTALTALSISEGLDMPTLTTATAAIADLATRIRAAIDSGHGGRLVVGNQEQSFSWVPGPAVTLLSYLSQGTVTGRTTTIVRAKNSGTVVGPVLEGGQKSNVVDFESEDVQLKKFPGQATITVESAQFVNNIEAAVSTVIVSQVIRALEQDAAGVIEAASGVEITDAADMTAGVLAAIAAIKENGGSPNVVGLNSGDWVDLMTATGAAGGFTNFVSPESGPGPTWMGLAPCIIPGQAAGTAIVADGRSVTVSEPAGGPLAIVDPFTMAGTNKIVITIEAFAVSAVTSPGGVATVAVAMTP